MKITMIAAMATNRTIGLNNQMPWHLPSDLRHFKRMTAGKPMIMGRKTFESFGGRPLPGRPHIVLSRRSLTVDSGHSGRVFPVQSIREALRTAAYLDRNGVFVIGGQNIYEQFMPLAHRLVLTELDQPHEGDTFFPPMGDEWKLESETILADRETPYVVRTYVAPRG